MDEALKYHYGVGYGNKKGKIGTQVKRPCDYKDLPLAYTPGVAKPCIEIKNNPSKVYDYTNKGNTVAVITNGSSVLGLGDIGVLASKPVMEGKAMLFKCLADIDATDVLVDTKDPEEFIDTVKKISKTYGAINLEDIKAPDCFYITEKLIKSLDVPVFHDDQDGTAIVVSAGLLNALRIANKKIDEVKIVFSGAGSAGIAIARMFCMLGASKKNIIMCDSKGVLYKGREMNEVKKEFAVSTNLRKIEDTLAKADVFVGVSRGGILTPKMLSSMNKKPIVFALANPEPEIDYNLAKKTREDIIICTGRSDFPNQINNLLVFPFLFRGVLDVMAKEINAEMKIAASETIAKIAEKNPEFGKEFIIPKPFDQKLLTEIPFVVAKAAIKTGVTGKKINPESYHEELKKMKSEINQKLL